MGNGRNETLTIHQKSKSEENCGLILSQYQNMRPLNSKKWPRQVRELGKSCMEFVQSLQRRRQRYIEALAKQQLHLLSKCKRRKSALKNFSKLGKCQTLTHQNVSADKACNPQSNYQSNAVYIPGKRTVYVKKIEGKQYLGR